MLRHRPRECPEYLFQRQHSSGKHVFRTDRYLIYEFYFTKQPPAKAGGFE